MSVSRKNEEIELFGEVRSYSIRKSKRAKNILVHVDLTGEIEVVVPRYASYKMANKFVQQQRKWLEGQLLKKKTLRRDVPTRKYITGEKFPLLGKEFELKVEIDELRKRQSFKDGKGFVKLYLQGGYDAKKVLKRWYEREARDYFSIQLASMSKKLGVGVNSLTISSARSQWGSCNKRTGRISLQWRLLLAPKEIADYVVAHEVAHLVIDAHNKRFWQQVEKLDKDYKDHRKWLRTNGHKMVL